MQYHIDRQNYQIRIEGSTQQIQTMVRAIDTVLTSGSTIGQIRDRLDSLESAVDTIQYNPTRHHRLYISRNFILYVPNVSLTAREFWFKMVEKSFDEARCLVKKFSEE